MKDFFLVIHANFNYNTGMAYDFIEVLLAPVSISVVVMTFKNNNVGLLAFAVALRYIHGRFRIVFDLD